MLCRAKRWPFFECRQHFTVSHGICLLDDKVIENLAAGAARGFMFFVHACARQSQ